MPNTSLLETYNTRKIMAMFKQFAKRYYGPKYQTIKLEMQGYGSDKDIYAKAKEFFDANPNEQEVEIDLPSRETSVLIDREHPIFNL